MHDETKIERARLAARANPGDLRARFAFAQLLVQSEAFDDALAEYVELWPRMRGAPHTWNPLNDLIQLVGAHERARVTFAHLRDTCEVGSDDWLDLTIALGGDLKRILEWFDVVRDQLQDDAEIASRVERCAIPLLCEAGRWADAGHAYVRPRATLGRIFDEHARTHAKFGNKNDSASTMMIELIDRLTLHQVSRLRRALHAARRDDEVRTLDDAVQTVNAEWLQSLRAPGK